jgi:hypothetical protein
VFGATVKPPVTSPGGFSISALRNLKAAAAKITLRLSVGSSTEGHPMVLTFALMVSSILLGLFVAALVLSALETFQQCADE